MSLYDDAFTEYGNRNGSLTFTYNGNTYNPYDFTSNAILNAFYDSAIGENAAGNRTVFLTDPSNPSQVVTISNSTFISIKILAINAIQQLRDGYQYILAQIGNGTITSTSQIPTVWNMYNSTYSTNRILEPTNEALNNSIMANAPVQADWTQASSANLSFIKNKPTLATVATTGSYNDLSNKPTIPTLPTRTFTYPTRSLNTVFQISSTQDALVVYSVDISCSLSLTGGTTGTIYLETADNSAFTANVHEVCRTVNGNTGTLTIGLNITQNATFTASGIIPASKYVKLRPDNTVGTPTFTWRSGQEVLLG